MIAQVGTEWFLFGGAGLLSLLAFSALILAPALGSFSRGWEKAAVTLLSLVVLVVLAALGVALGVLIVYFWDDITAFFS